MANAEGVDLLGGGDMDPFKVATALCCLAVQEHPEMTDEEAFAIAIRAGDAVGTALTELFAKFGGSTEGNAKAKPKAKRRR